jgi:hypothetical protein
MPDIHYGLQWIQFSARGKVKNISIIDVISVLALHRLGKKEYYN